MSDKCVSPCATCPWLVKNHGKPNPANVEKLKEHDPNFTDWYSTKNLRRLWRGAGMQGHGMICHSSDPKAGEYGGESAKPGHERICAGLLGVVSRHLQAFNQLARSHNAKQRIIVRSLYREQAGKDAISIVGFAKWIERVIFDPEFPKSVECEEAIGVPWDSPLSNRTKKKVD